MRDTKSETQNERHKMRDTKTDTLINTKKDTQ